MPQSAHPDSHFTRKMPKKQGKVTLKKLRAAIKNTDLATLSPEEIRSHLLHSAFLWIENDGKDTVAQEGNTLPEALNALLKRFLFADSSTPLLQQLEQLAFLSEAFHPNPKASGVFYTPPALVHWIVDRCFEYISPSEYIRFCAYDPACGSGLFLWAAYEKLRSLYPNANEAQARYWQEHLLGTDLDRVALEVARFGLRQLWRRDYPFTPLPLLSIYALNALEIAPDQPVFKLHVETQIPHLAHVNLVMGNPPYLGEKGHLEQFKVLKHPQWKPYYRPRGDLYYAFYYLTLHLLKQSKKSKALASLLTPNYFFSATQARHLRRTLHQEISPLECVDFGSVRIFTGAGGQHNQNLIFRHQQAEEPHTLAQVKLEKIQARGKFSLEKLAQSQTQQVSVSQWGNRAPDYSLNWSNFSPLELPVHRMKGRPLHRYFTVYQGLVTGADTLSLSQKKRYDIDLPVGSDIFVLQDRTYHQLKEQGISEAYFRPWNKSSAISPYTVKPSQAWLLYLQRHHHRLPPPLAEHLQPFYELLASRREVKLQQMHWFHIQWPRLPERFEGPKLVLPQRARNCRAAYIETPFYASADVYFIHPRNPTETGIQQLKALVCLLNHPLYTLIQWLTGKRKGRMIELYQTPLSELIVPDMTPAFCQQILKVFAQERLQSNKAEPSLAFLELLLKGLHSPLSGASLKDFSDRLWEWYQAR
jgi:hypothetical protein